jgi:hypothetical protein
MILASLAGLIVVLSAALYFTSASPDDDVSLAIGDESFQEITEESAGETTEILPVQTEQKKEVSGILTAKYYYTNESGEETFSEVPLSNCEIEIGGERTRTDSQGAYSVLIPNDSDANDIAIYYEGEIIGNVEYATESDISLATSETILYDESVDSSDVIKQNFFGGFFHMPNMHFGIITVWCSPHGPTPTQHTAAPTQHPTPTQHTAAPTPTPTPPPTPTPTPPPTPTPTPPPTPTPTLPPTPTPTQHPTPTQCSTPTQHTAVSKPSHYWPPLPPWPHPGFPHW